MLFRSAFPGAVMVIEEEQAIYGENPWEHGLTARNVAMLEKFILYAHQQGYIRERPRVSDVFANVGDAVFGAKEDAVNNGGNNGVNGAVDDAAGAAPAGQQSSALAA